MKRDLLTHFSFMLALFILIAVANHWFTLTYIVPFAVGGLIGTLLPDVDHFIYAYITSPTDLTSQRVAGLLSQRQFFKAWDLLVITRAERRELIFHTIYFQLIFWVFALLVITSSGSTLAQGIVTAFALHLLIDQVTDFMQTKNINNWFDKLNITLDIEQTRWYLIGNFITLIVFGFFI
ncbi:hypothetical protein A2115_03720 [Candidatus Woesebacteria bacterium GWA1_41_8]|jgi:hypothetical protein|uniref:Uncharacterized protein n=1 Tax=Candidatus Woesebacteria bacterium GWA1_41_8 TaxID=1802471 RepID=A0A1F7WIF0_9BACT|nr:MAG: hypothetical protein A2115_03720 [Candidatus Woesebacteria bacterium GWA1_41_8]